MTDEASSETDEMAPIKVKKELEPDTKSPI